VSVREQVKPSQEARRLFNKLVSKADEGGMISLSQTIALDVQLKRERHDATSEQVRELLEEGWIEPADDGGWQLPEPRVES
jgi:hypothetical protein